LNGAAVFLDTSAWLAAFIVREKRHAQCAKLYDDLLAARTIVLTTTLVVSEMHGLLVRRRGPADGLRFLDLVRSDPAVEIVRVDEDLEEMAIESWLRRYNDLPLSLTDAASFEAMRSHGVRTAFTLDRHFAATGFRMVPAPGSR
jgi:predicted nucleic acid-binding protein